MDKRVLRTKKGKPRNARPYDRPNQSILGKVASKVKGLLNPSWLFNVSQWIGGGEEEPGCSTEFLEDEPNRNEDFTPQSSLHGSKRPRLGLQGHAPSNLSAGTQTWLEPPPPQSHSLYDSPSSLVSSSATQSSILEHKNSSVAMNGDDHSENSEGSASTSGCSSLVSSHKDRFSNLPTSGIRLSQSALENLRGELKDSIGIKSRRDVGSQKGGISDLNASRTSLWSSPFSPAAKFQRRPVSVAQSSQPSFNLSSFVGPSKLNQSTEKVSSPFYRGKTTFGGAASTRRMPASVAPYQVDKTVRNQIKVREHHSEDSLEGMSSAAKRILLTLEKMSSPVLDAKKIPNSDTSPVDLKLYLVPPKHRKNSQLTSASTKGPPIANINTIAKLTTLKNYGIKKFRNSVTEIPVMSNEKRNIELCGDSLNQISTDGSLKSGGGKMKTKLNQQHHSSMDKTKTELPAVPSLPNIPLPVSKLPVINFGTKLDKKLDNNQTSESFTFSRPIEHVLPLATTLAATTPSISSVFESKSDKSKTDGARKAFTFSSPIEILPVSSIPSNVSVSQANSVSSSSAVTSTVWECSTCWVRNPASESKCCACETIRPGAEKCSGKEGSTGFQFNSLPQTGSSTFKFGNFTIPTKPSEKFSFGSEKEISKPSSTSSKPSPPQSQDVTNSSTPFVKNAFPGISTNTWECDTCLVRNPFDKSKCIACETARPTKEGNSGKESATGFQFNSLPQTGSNTFKFGSDLSKCNKSEGFSFVSEKDKPTNAFSFKSSTPVSQGVSTSSTPVVKNVLLPGISSSTWECDTCFVRNPLDKLKCIACETLRPVKEGSSDMKDPESFKFSSPLQTGPIAFKFGSLTSSQNTSTTSSFSFNASTSSSTFFSTASNTISASTKISETPAIPSGTTAFKIPSTGFNLDAKKLSTVEETKPEPPVIEISDANNSNEKQTETLGTVSESDKNCDKSNLKQTENQKSLSESIKKTSNETNSPFAKLSRETISPFAKLSNEASSSFTKLSNETSSPFVNKKRGSDASDVEIVYSAPSTNVTSKIKESAPVPSSTNDHFTFGSQSVESKKVTDNLTFGMPKDKDKPGFVFNFKAASTAAPPFGGFSGSVSNKEEVNKSSEATTSEKNSQQSLSKDTTQEKVSPFQLPSQTSAASLFTLPASVAPTFKFGDKTDTPKATFESPSPTENALSTSTSDTTSTTIPSFSFSNTSSNTFALISNSQPSETKSVSGQFQPVVTKSQEAKIGIPPFTSVPTTNTFAFGNSTAVSSTSGQPGFTFFASTTSSAIPPMNSSVFTFGASSNTTQASKPGGFMFKGLSEEKQNSLPSNTISFNAPTTSTTTTSVFKFGSSVPSSTSGSFVFGNQAPKPETQSVASAPFVFGSGNVSAANPSTYLGFQPNQTVTPFQFGSQSSGNTTGQATFGASNNIFGFGTKTETTNQIPCTVSQAAPAPFGCQSMSPAFGNAAAPIFGRPERPATPSGGFNFSVAATSTPVFRFGNSNVQEKKTTPSAVFSFGTPSQAETSNTFQSGFNMSTPPNFNFGATSTTAGPFQFVASSEGATSQTSAPRKYRKAVRRVLRKRD